MEHEIEIIVTLTGALAVALALGLVAQKARLSPIVGYLLAGVVVGPFTPGFVAHAGIASQFAELGVILLMFGVGLNLHVKELVAVRRVAVPGAVAAMLAASAAGFGVGRVFGWAPAQSVVYGIAIAIASTVVVLRVYADRGILHAQPGHIAIGWLLVEDLFVVMVLVLLPAFVGGGGASGVAIARAVGVALAKIALLVAFTLVIGRRVIPPILGAIARTGSRELFTLAVLVVALGVAVGSAKLFGASMALGAFLAGLVVGQTDFGGRAASEALPMRDAFAVLFFVATGMQLDPGRLAATLPLVALTLAAVFVVKPLVALVLVLRFGYSAKTALAVALGLAQLGEFSFMVAALGAKLGVLPAEAGQSLVVAAMVTITASPVLQTLVPKLAGPLARFERADGPRSVGRSETDPRLRVVVVGYGPIGRSLTALLRESGLVPTVIDLDHERVAELKRAGVDAVYGDASQRAILERAGAARSHTLVYTASTPPEAVIRTARELHPGLVVMARTGYLRDVSAVAAAGASEVIPAEGEVALAIVERVLGRLGATPEQLDRARARVRAEMGGEGRSLAPEGDSRGDEG